MKHDYSFSRVFVTGDTHGTRDIIKFETLVETCGKELKQDPAPKLMIICGDFGLIFEKAPDDWERAAIAVYRELYEVYGITVVTCLGNHENYGRIYGELDEVPLFGGKVYRITKDFGPYYLENGGYYEISYHGEPFTLFAFGGAASRDYSMRKKGLSWWPQEIPSRKMFRRGMANLKKHQHYADYFITHTLPIRLKQAIFENTTKGLRIPHENTTEKMLQKFMDQNRWGHWFCGHQHQNINITDFQMTLLYNDIVELDPATLQEKKRESAD